MSGMTAQQQVNLQLEQVSPDLNLAVEKANELDKYIQDNGRSTKVGIKSFRVPFESALPGTGSKVDLDATNVSFPVGGSSEYQQGTVTPLATMVTIEWSKLAELTQGPEQSIHPTVARQVGRATDRIKQLRDMGLNTDGTGKLATISAVDGVNRLLTIDTGRLIVKNQPVVIFNGNAKRNTCNVTKVNKTLGGTQTVQVDVVPAGTVAGDFIRLDGMEDGAPRWVDGIPVFHSNATNGIVMGVDRGNDYVVANGIDAGNGQVTQPLLLLPFNQIFTALGDDSVIKDLVLHTNTAQVAALEEMGWQLQTAPMAGGGWGDFDPLFKGKKMVNGRPIIISIHASDVRWDYMSLKAYGKVKWGNPPFWFDQGNGKVFPIYGANGSVTAGARSHLVDTSQYYVDNYKSLSSITNAKKPANY